MTQKVAVVTGASSGIGEELCYQLAKEGYAIGLIARGVDKLGVVHDTLVARGTRALVAAADVRDREQIKAACDTIRAGLGSIDLLVANAGVSANLNVESFDLDNVERMYAINVFGVLNTVAAVLPYMIEARAGHIVGISSLASYRGYPHSHGYAATKAAINTHFEGLRMELEKYHVTVTTVCPGFIRTPLTEGLEDKLPFMLNCDDACRRIVTAIKTKQAVVNFPLPLYLASRIGGLLPDIIVRPFAPGGGAFLHDKVR